VRDDTGREVEASAPYGAIACVLNATLQAGSILAAGRSYTIVVVEEKEESVG